MPFTGSIYTGVGTFFAKDDRQAALSHFVEGVRQTDGQSPLAALAVTPHSPADLSVDVGVGWAIVKGDDVQNQSNYMDFNNAASRVQLPGSAPPPSSPGTSRIDAIVAKLNDSEAKVVPSGEPADQMFFQWVPGTAQAGVTLASPGTSPPAIPPTSLLLAWVQVDNAASQIQAGQILDKRKLYAPAIPGADGHVYRFTVSSQGTPALEVVS